MRSDLPPNDGARGTAIQTLSSLLQLTVVGVLIGVLLFQGTELFLAVQALFVILLLLLIGRTSAAPLLVAFQLVLFFRETKSSSTLLDAGSSLFVLIVLGLLMFLSRDETLKRFTRRSVMELARSLFTRGNVPTVQPVVAPSSLLVPVVQGAMLLTLCVLAAQIVLMQLPLPGEVQRGQPSFDEMRQTLASAPTLLTALLASVLVMSWLSWCRLTRGQASLYARSTLVSLLYSDLSLIVRHRIHFRRRERLSRPANIALEIERAIASKDEGQNDGAQNDQGGKHRSFRLSRK